MCVCIYIYIYLSPSLSISFSLSLYIYIYTHVYSSADRPRLPGRNVASVRETHPHGAQAAGPGPRARTAYAHAHVRAHVLARTSSLAQASARLPQSSKRARFCQRKRTGNACLTIAAPGNTITRCILSRCPHLPIPRTTPPKAMSVALYHSH